MGVRGVLVREIISRDPLHHIDADAGTVVRDILQGVDDLEEGDSCRDTAGTVLQTVYVVILQQFLRSEERRVGKECRL